MRRSVATLAALLAGTLASAGPAAAEWTALRALRQGVARCPGDRADAVCGGLARADVDLDGLRLWHAWREQAGVHVEAEEISVTVDRTGLRVDAHGLRLGRGLSPPRPSRQLPPRLAADPKAPGPRPGRPPLHTRGIPVHVHAHGQAVWSSRGLTLTVEDPELHLDGHGGATAGFGASLKTRGLHARGVERWTARAVDGDPRRWHAEGAIELADGPTAQAALTVSRQGLHAVLHDAEGGHVTLTTSLPEGGGMPASIGVRAEGFALSTLGRVGEQTRARWGVHIDDARLDAELELEGLGSAEAAARVDQLVVEGLVVDHPKLARAPVELDALALHGEVSWSDTVTAGSLWLAHREARIMVHAQLGPDAFDLRTELAPLPCQALVDAFPMGMSEMVEGTRLEGELEGRAELHLDRRALARARAEAEVEHPTPGRLDFEFPFLERCTVVADDPRLDLAALSGPYRHRFVDERGHERTRLMVAGAPGYVSLREVPLLARAFVVLEDRRFWHHDGFDREQIEGAFWHNLVQGRVSRGASTISQQATRNLWLGVDRSWGRKLQEALLTARLEASTDKARIMELYLNVIELGPGAHGVDEAARLYFGKPAARLSVLQAIHLAALAPAPQRFAVRFIDGQVDAEWNDMLREHVRRMHRAGLIDYAQMAAALRDDLGLLDRSRGPTPS